MKIKRACLVFLFPKILILRFHMWSLDLLPVTGGICWKRLQAAEPTTQRGERGASRRRGRASPLKQPLAGVRRTRRRWTRLPGAPQPLPLASTRSYAVMSRRRRAHKSLTDPFTVITFKAQKKKTMIQKNHHESPKRLRFLAKLSSVGVQVRARPPKNIRGP